VSTSHRVYLILSGSIFFLVAMLHLFRLVYHLPIVVGTWMVPHWLSYVGFPVAYGYSVWAYWLFRR
jgi:hypothetical protein